MAKVEVSSVDNDDLDRQAIQWLVRLTSGDAGPNELKKFDTWRRTSPDHEEAVRRARQLWIQLGNTQTMASRIQTPVSSTVRPFPSRILRNHWRFALAAILVMAVGVVQWHNDWRYTYATGSGAPRSFLLADGSTLWLDVNSAVNVHMKEGQRQVTLARGKAFFDVVRDPTHPFTVDAGFGHVSVLGTAFAVQRNSNEVVVTVVRGKVMVTGGDVPGVTLTPDEQVSMRAGGEHSLLHVDAGRKTAWHRGWLIFEKQTLAEIVNNLKRYDNRLVFMTYPDADKIRLDAMIELDQLNDWYDGLERSLPVRIDRIGPFVWLH